MVKRGMFFSLITILMVLVIILSYKISTNKSPEETKLASTQIRIKMLNSFINDLENVYFEDMLNVAAKTALEALANYTATGNLLREPIRYKLARVNQYGANPGDFEIVMLFGYIEDTFGGNFCGDSLCMEYGARLSEAQLNRLNNNCKLKSDGTICEYRKIDKDLKKPVMQQYSFFDLLNQTENTLENLGVKTESFSIKIIDDLKQEGKWNVIFTAAIDYHFIDNYEIAAWRGRTEKTINISIIGLEDPLTGKKIDRNWKEDKGPDGCGASPCMCGLVPCAYNYPSFLNRLKPETDSNNIYGICSPEEDCDTT